MAQRSARGPLVAGIGAGVALALGTGPVVLADRLSSSEAALQAAPVVSPAAAVQAPAAAKGVSAAETTTAPAPKTTSSPVKTPASPAKTSTAPKTTSKSTTTAKRVASPSSSSTKQPSDDPTDPPAEDKKASLKVTVAAADRSAHGGESVKATFYVDAGVTTATKATLTFSVSGGGTATPTCQKAGGVCANASLKTDGMWAVPVTIKVPSKMKSGHIRVKATANAANAQSTASSSVTVTVTEKKKKKKEKKKKSNTSDNNTTTPTQPSTPPSTPSTPVPTPSSTTPGAVLPEIQQLPGSQTPVTAPAGDPRNLRAAAGDPQELTFDRIARTQAAWLAALLAAFSLLLTQLKLGKTPLGRMPAPRRAKGAHRIQGAHRKRAVKKS